MRRLASARVAIVVLVLALGAAVAGDEEKEKEKDEDEIHVCLDRSGEVVYQSYPCEERPSRPREPQAPAPDVTERKAPAKRPPAPVSRPAAPEAPERSAPRRTAPEPTEAPRARALPRPGVAERRPASWQLVGRPSPDRPSAAAKGASGSVDPRFATPERTWQTFSAAMREADRAAARACLTSSALRDLGPLIDSSAPERLSELVGQAVRVHLEGDVGPFWSLRISRARERPKWVFLVRTEGGEWKIAEI